MKGRLDFFSSCEQSRIHERHKKHFFQTHAHTHTYTRTCAHTRIPWHTHEHTHIFILVLKRPETESFLWIPEFAKAAWISWQEGSFGGTLEFNGDCWLWEVFQKEILVKSQIIIWWFGNPKNCNESLWLHTQIHTHTHTHAHAHTRTRTRTRTHEHAFTRAHTHTHKNKATRS